MSACMRFSFCSISIILLLLSWGCGRTGPTVEEVQKAVTSELPLGSSVDEVRKFLHSKAFNTKRFINSAYYKDPEILSMVLNSSSRDLKAIELKGTLKGYLSGTIPDVERDIFNQHHIVASFYFGENERLIYEKVDEELSK
jgi:hypothetical protein